MTLRQVQFEGICDDLKKHIFDCGQTKMTEKYSMTIKEIADYVGREYHHGDDVRKSVERLKDSTFTEINDPDPSARKTTIRIWKEHVYKHMKRTNYYTENMKSLYSLVWGQCTDIMHAKLESLDTFHKMSKDADSINLIKAIKGIVFNFQYQKYQPQSLHEARRHFYMFSQDRAMYFEVFLEKFQNLVVMLEHCGGALGEDEGVIERIKLKKSGISEADARAKARDFYPSCAFYVLPTVVIMENY